MVIIVKISLKNCDKYDPSKYTCTYRNSTKYNYSVYIFWEFDACDN